MNNKELENTSEIKDLGIRVHVNLFLKIHIVDKVNKAT